MSRRISADALEQYRGQLNRWVAALAADDAEAVAADAAEPYGAGDVDLFTEGNESKRAEILSLQLESLRPAFADLDRLIDEYMAARPLRAFAAGPADASAFLRWLLGAFELTPEQIDYVSCRQARFDVEDAARRRRVAHIRFQELRSVACGLAGRLRRNPRLRVHLNPARGWARLQTREFLDEETTLPGTVVFFAVDREIHSAVLDHPAPALLKLLERKSLTLGTWAKRAGLSGLPELFDVTARLAEVGLVAFS